MDVCRACLAPNTSEKMVCLDKQFIRNYNSLTGLKVKLLDGLPQQICLHCTSSIKSFALFRNQCITSEKTLKLEKNTTTDAALKRSRRIKEKREKSIEDIPPLLDDITKEQCVAEMLIKPEIKEEFLDESIFDYDLHLESEETSLWYIKNEGSKCLKEEDLQGKIATDYKSANEEKLPKLRKRKKYSTGQKLFKTEDLPCGLCKKHFPETEVEAYVKHVESHKDGLQCHLCVENFYSWSEIVGHRVTHLQGSKRCYLCTKVAITPECMEYHYRKVHCKENDILMTCKHCLRTYPTPRKLRKHLQGSHVHATVSKKYMCDICSKGFTSKSYLTNHIRCHNNKKEFVCHLCGYASNIPQGLWVHTNRMHNADKTYCPTCRACFRNQEALGKHTCRQGQCVCPTCGRIFRTNKLLKTHLLSHNPIPKFKCDRCPASFRSRGNLKIHIDKHNGTRTQKCEYCDRAFYSASVLIKHRRVHTGEKPYVCKVCNKGFTGNHNLKVHMKVHGEHLVVKRTQEVEPELVNLTVKH